MRMRVGGAILGLACMLLIIPLLGVANGNCPLTEDFSQDTGVWTEYDPDGKIELDFTSDHRLEFNNWIRYNPGYVSKPYSTQDFVLDFDIRITASGGNAKVIGPGFSDSLGTIDQIQNGVHVVYYAGFPTVSPRLSIYTRVGGPTEWCCSGNPPQPNRINISKNVTYYVRLEKSGSTLTLSVFSDPGRTVHVSGSPKTVTTALSGTTFNYFYAVNGYTTSPVGNWEWTTGWIDNIRVCYNPPGSAAEDTIVFASDRSGNYDIWRVNMDGSGLYQLTHSPSREDYPHWNSDGTKIAYTNWDDGIHVMNADGTGDYLVPNTDPKVGALGPDIVVDWGPCDKILFSTEEPNDGWGGVYEINPGGTGRRRLTDGNDGDHPTAGWAPGCTQFVFAEGTPYVGGSSKVAVSPVDIFSPTILDPSSTRPLEWSPDGEWILYYQRSLAELWKIKPDGSGASKVIAGQQNGTFTSDSSQIIYAVSGDLWIADLAGSSSTKLTNGPDTDTQPDAFKFPQVSGEQNSPPTADAGPDQSVDAGDMVQLDGSGSFDPDGDPLTYTWSFLSKPCGSTAALSNPNSTNPTFLADKEGTYKLQLEVNDGRGGTDTDEMEVNGGGLMGYWRFEGDVQDCSGNGRHGSVSIGSPGYVVGVSGLGIELTDDRVDIPWAHDNWDAFTVEVWFHLKNMTAGCGQCTDADGCNIWMDEELNGPGTWSHVDVHLAYYNAVTDEFDYLGFVCDDGNSGTQNNYASYTEGVSQYHWHHIVMTSVKGGESHAYYDSQLVGSWPQAGWGTPGVTLYLGGRDFRDDNLLTDGILDELYIYNRALDPSEFHDEGPTTTEYTLTVTLAGDGSGTVTSNPIGIDCGVTCTASYDQGTPVTLTATPDANSVFAGWSGCDSSSGNQCTVTMDTDRTVTATFNPLGLRGDINGDGKINIIDVLMLYRYLYDVINLTPEQLLRADMDEDGDVDMDDAHILEDIVFRG